MTRRDFQLIASVLAECEEKDRDYVRLVDRFADRLAGTNPRFDRGRFALACGVDPIVLLAVTEQDRARVK